MGWCSFSSLTIGDYALSSIDDTVALCQQTSIYRKQALHTAEHTQYLPHAIVYAMLPSPLWKRWLARKPSGATGPLRPTSMVHGFEVIL